MAAVTSDPEELTAIVGKAKQGRTWFFTYWNPPEARLNGDWPREFGASGWSYQLENAPTSGRPHLQGCIRWDANRTKKWVTERIWAPDLETKPKGDRLETCISWKGAYAYCSKEASRADGGPWQFGGDSEGRTYAEQRAILRTMRLDEAIEVLNVAPTQVMSIARAADVLRRPFYGEPRFVYLYGEADAGKTHYVYQRHSEPDVFPYVANEGNPNSINRYGGQPVVMFEEFDKLRPFPAAWILQFMDRGLKSIRYVGGAAPSSAEVYYFCGNLAPWDLPLDRHTRNGFLRRLAQRGTVIHAHLRTYTEIPLLTEAPWGPAEPVPGPATGGGAALSSAWTSSGVLPTD